jgi:hypothetical protein
MHNLPVFVHSLDPISFSLLIGKVACTGKEPNSEWREALIDIAAHNIKYLSRTGARLGEIVKWVQDNFPTLDEAIAFVNNIPIPVLLLTPKGM